MALNHKGTTRKIIVALNDKRTQESVFGFGSDLAKHDQT